VGDVRSNTQWAQACEAGEGTTASGASSEAAAQTSCPRALADDAAVIEALRRGDEEAFTRLVDQLHASLRRLARLYVSSPAVADEVVQDTWLAVIQGVWAFEGRSSLRTWILRILINRAKTRALREGRTAPFAELGLDDPEPFGVPTVTAQSTAAGEPGPSLRCPAPSPEANLLTNEARVQIHAAINALPTRQRMVITMRDLEGYSSEEVCNVLGLSETNQRVILHRARSKVRAMLAAYYLDE
jgi:RNA polymerase sigma-70 factor, ECF subfamily